MHPYISHSTWRREAWRGHENKEGVRRAIKYNNGRSATLRIFVRNDEFGTEYTEVSPHNWGEMFAD